MNNVNKNYVFLGLILGTSFIIGISIASVAFYKLRSMNLISTTGSAKKSVVSDKVKWTSSINREAKISDIKNAYTKLDFDLKEVKNFLISNGINPESISISPVYMNEVYEQYPGSEKKYSLLQNIKVESEDVIKISELAKNTSSLIAQKGILFSTNSLEYYYSKLPETRIELISNAVGDAKKRATELASAGGKKIGILKSASLGVTQVLSPNSTDVSDYGIYDTSSIDKEIMITVKATFEVN